jgi:predicted nucleotidyltransferase component of viral defense system
MIWLNLSAEDRLTVLNNAYKKLGLQPKSVEKDWWVTMTLRALFRCECANHIVFKGGTSLSKAWNLIERFSEDIDIAIDRKFFGFDGELKKKQINDLRRASCTYISGALKNELDNQLKEAGLNSYTVSVEETQDSTKDPQIIEIQYDSLINTGNYIREKVLIEIGARSLIEPSENVKIRSIIANAFPDATFADDYISIPTVIPQRTFLEKAFLLHEEFQKPEERIRVNRMTRHIYDLERMMDTDFANDALNNSELYKAIVKHRSTLTKMKEVDYSTHTPDKISFVPPDFVIDAWRNDYESMQGYMIYGESLSFDKLIERIKELNNRFREIRL